MEIIKSINYNQQEIINNILQLYNNGNSIDLDCTYSKGVFYKNGIVQEPKHKSDIKPLFKDVIKADSMNLPFPNDFFQCIMCDLPFLATSGESLKENNGNIINKRFSIFENEIQLHQVYLYTIQEVYRVLRENGILIFKCQDKVSSGNQYFSHVVICEKAINIGYYPLDLFILLSKNRIIANWQKNQKHARKYHSYFWVFKKCNKKINYGI